MRLPPLCIRKTWTVRPPKPLDESSWETMHDHLLSVTQNSETGPNVCKARIAGRKVSEVCFVRGVKAICVETEDDVRSRAAEWIGQDEVVDGPSNIPPGIETDD